MSARLLAPLFALAGGLLLAGCGASEEQWPEPSPALWQVASPSGDTGWLLGTIHALPGGAQWRTAALDRAQAGTGVLVVEIANPGDPATQTLFEGLASSPGLPPLVNRIAPEDRDDLRALIAAADADDAQFADVETWGAALMLAGAVSTGDPANGVDRALLADAATRNKPVIALETAAQQFALFDTLPQADQSALLSATAQEAAADPRIAVEAWLTGDLVALATLAETGLLAHPALRERLLAGRNRAWAQRIGALISGGRRPFVAVGAAHMLGDDGLPALLAARGYTVRRVQ